MPSPVPSILNPLTDFYLDPNYESQTNIELRQSGPLPTITYSYGINNQSRVKRIAKIFLLIIIFPYGLYRVFRSIVGQVVIVAALLAPLYVSSANLARTHLATYYLYSPWKYKRITLQIDGQNIDAMIVGTPGTLNNKKWLLLSQGNAGMYENMLDVNNTDFYKFLGDTQSNALLFNYPGVGSSEGSPSKATLVKAYRAALKLLEGPIGANKICGWGFSIGGGIQAEALLNYPLSNRIKYLFIKEKTFDTLSNTARDIRKCYGRFIKFFGWNLRTAESSKKLAAPEIIIQTANVPSARIISSSNVIQNDGVITANSSLAKALLDAGCTQNKVFIGDPLPHDQHTDYKHLALHVNALL